MKVRTRGVAGGADLAYILTLRYGLTRADAYAAEVRISCPHAVAVVYKHDVAPALVIRSGNYRTACRGVNGLTVYICTGYVNALVAVVAVVL